MNSKVLFSDQDPKSCSEIYDVLNSHQLMALSFHDDMTDLFDFLGLEGFKCMHEYQYYSESDGHNTLKEYYLNHHDKLLSDEDLESIKVIPEDWYRYRKSEVTPSIRKQAVQKAMKQYKDWETDTKALYERCAGYLLEWNKIADFNTVNCFIKDVDEELENLNKLCTELEAVEYDDEYMMYMQKDYQYKYSELLEDIGD